MERREFLKVMAAAAAAAPTLSRCADEATPPLRETAPTRFTGYRGLAELPYFELDAQGRLRCTVRDLPAGVDFHVHLGMAYLAAPAVDLLVEAEQTQYLIDCDGMDPACTVDLEQYLNLIATDEMLAKMQSLVIDSGLPMGSDAARTHTIPNLLREMDAMGIAKAVILPVAMEEPFGDADTERWFTAIASAGATDRLIPYASVHPRDDQALSKLEDYHRRGLRGLKLHPVTQRFYADDERAMAIYEKCAALDIPVLFHAGRAGIEPESVRDFGRIERYTAAVAGFPKVRFVFGHAGCAFDFEGALALAKAHDNVWLELSGQGLPELDRLLAEFDPERLLFGTDWPFYPEAPTLAKILLVTDRDKALRRLLLEENAERFLAG